MVDSAARATLGPRTQARAAEALVGLDSIFASVIDRWGMPPFWTSPRGFEGLTSAILAQQVSLESAHAAMRKLRARLGRIDATAFLALDDAALKLIGFSRPKMSYVRGIAAALVDGSLDLEALERCDNATARARLIAVRGIGPWTADTYLLFAMRRADAWPSGDIALVAAAHELGGFRRPPSFGTLDRRAERWRPWRAMAARLLWHHYLSARGRQAPV